MSLEEAHCFEKTVNKALTQVLNQMVHDLTARQQQVALPPAPNRTLQAGNG